MDPTGHAGAASTAAPSSAMAARRRRDQLRCDAPEPARLGRHAYPAITADEPTVQGGPGCDAPDGIAFLGLSAPITVGGRL